MKPTSSASPALLDPAVSQDAHGRPRHHAGLDDALRSTGLRATQVPVLAAVGARGALSIKSLADSLEMDRTTLTRDLRPLEERGYVLLAPERRHRSRMLTLTAAGHAALLEALPLWEDAQADPARLGRAALPASRRPWPSSPRKSSRPHAVSRAEAARHGREQPLFVMCIYTT